MKVLKIYIGPNGYGKTTALNNEKDKLLEAGIKENEILFLESEILLGDEIKDTKESTKTMEFVIQELLLHDKTYVKAKIKFEKEVDRVIGDNVKRVNDILEETLKFNDEKRNSSKDVIDVTSQKEYKKLVKINSKDYLDKMGSGQRMQFILRLVVASKSKKYIFLDEPEKYSHPSLLNETAKLIRKLYDENKNVYIATHSPKLLSMLEIDFENLIIINDKSHAQKRIDFDAILSKCSFKCLNMLDKKSKSFYKKDSLIKNIKEIYYKEFVECLFTRQIYLCEGINDLLFIKKMLIKKNMYYSDYCIFQTWGKYMMPVFDEIFNSLGIACFNFFDIDTKEGINTEINNHLNKYKHYAFNPNIESEIGFKKEKFTTTEYLEFLDRFKFENDYLVEKQS